MQHDFTATNVVARLQQILADGAERNRMLEGLARVKSRLRATEKAGEPVTKHPADRAAEIILSLGNPRQSSQNFTSADNIDRKEQV